MLCGCDGPPHLYDPSWCIRPRFIGGGPRPTTVVVPAGSTVIVVPPR